MSGAITAGTIATVAGIGAAGSIGAAAIGSNAAGNAASAQEKAANNAAQLQYQESQNALDFQRQQWNQQQQNIAPWLQAGGGALNNLSYLMGINPNMSLGGQTTIPNGATPNGVSPSGSPSLPQGPNGMAVAPRAPLGSLGAPSLSGGPTANPVGAGQTLAGSQVAPAIGTDGRTFSGGMVPRASPIANPAAGADGGGSLASAGSPSLSGAGTPGGFGSLMTPYSGHFTAPTDITMQNDPGYQERMKLGTDAIERSAAARGGVLTGGTGKALDTYAQDYGSNEYNNVYNRALTGFTTDYNQYNQDQNTQFNRLAALSGVGQTAAGQLASGGQAAANNVSSNLLGTGSAIGQDYQNAGAANASGIYNSGAAYGGALGGIGGNLNQLLLLKQLGLGGGGAGIPSASMGMFNSMMG